MHVLVLLAQHHWTGPADSVLQLAQGLLGRGHRVTVVYTRLPSGHLSTHVDGTAMQTLPDVLLPRKGFHPLIVLRDWRRLRKYIRENGVDVLFCHHSHDHWTACALRWRLGLQVPVIRQIHTTSHLQYRADRVWLYRRCGGLIVAGEEWKQRLLQTFHLPPERVGVVPPGVDVGRFHPEQNKQAVYDEIKAKSEEKIIGMVGRIKPGRGHELALAAFALLRKRVPGIRLVFVGRGEGKEALADEVRRRGLADCVHFLGYRTDDLPAIYAAMDVHLVLGEGSDGTCRAAMESLACGTPVAALPVGALPGMLADGITGYFAEATAENLAEKIQKILSHLEMSAGAREYSTRNFSVENRVKICEELFTKWTCE